MTETQNKKTEITYKTDEKSLLEEFKAMLDDYFICNAEEKDSKLIFSLENGQSFLLHIEEINN